MARNLPLMIEMLNLETEKPGITLELQLFIRFCVAPICFDIQGHKKAQWIERWIGTQEILVQISGERFGGLGETKERAEKPASLWCVHVPSSPKPQTLAAPRVALFPTIIIPGDNPRSPLDQASSAHAGGTGRASRTCGVSTSHAAHLT
ncbi:hypothetical protein RRG08_031295 [Elysia crispata]|uniref:Uncharacterized protein n=1 Tax=Elysia crispata TaxID=231223 RepID=A0AAE1DZF5_9GAST|nr:hypothetical protein RRG08_031295 [Elysia crispata]